MNTAHTPESARINKLAMDLIGDLQMIPLDQAYERTKLALHEASQSSTLLSQRDELREALQRLLTCYESHFPVGSELTQARAALAATKE